VVWRGDRLAGAAIYLIVFYQVFYLPLGEASFSKLGESVSERQEIEEIS